MSGARSFSIITTCMGRLDDLQRSLPRMIEQRGAEVIVVDFSCPDQTAAYVRKHFPSVRVVSVEGHKFFSNWTARNAGAAVANGDILLFCDADIILAQDAVPWIADNLPENALGHFEHARRPRFNKQRSLLASNQLNGFQVMPAPSFRAAGGYDDVPQGYGAGGDYDLAHRLTLRGLEKCPLPDAIVDEVIEQDRSARTEHHALKIATSYCAGQLYRGVKFSLLRILRLVELPREIRVEIYRQALAAARRLRPSAATVGISYDLHHAPILMPKALGFAEADRRISLSVEIDCRKPLARK